MHDSMADITNANATRDHGAAGYVRNGMDLLTWYYSDDEWNRHLFARERRKWLATLAARKPSNVRWGWLYLGVLSVIGLFAGAVFESGVILGVGAAGVAGAIFGWGRSMQRRTADAAVAPEVLFTSTGVIFGAHARRWRGYRYRLTDARVRTGELAPVEPAYLDLEFAGSLRQTTLTIPVPAGLEQDAVELAESLQDMMLGSQLWPTDNADLPTTLDDLDQR